MAVHDTVTIILVRKCQPKCTRSQDRSRPVCIEETHKSSGSSASTHPAQRVSKGVRRKLIADGNRASKRASCLGACKGACTNRTLLVPDAVSTTVTRS